MRPVAVEKVPLSSENGISGGPRLDQGDFMKGEAWVHGDML